MALRLHSLVVDCVQPDALASWWSQALEWPVTDRAADRVVVAPEPEGPDLALPLVFTGTDELPPGKNRMHLDLASRSDAHQLDLVDRLRTMGAVEVDVGQRDVAWAVLADPEGNECCVLPPDARFDTPGALEAITIDARRPGVLAHFWAWALGWHIESTSRFVAQLRHPSGAPPALDLVAVDTPPEHRDTFHLALASDGTDRDAFVSALVRAGGAVVDASAAATVLADPEGNAFHVLADR